MKICFLGADFIGTATACAIALRCPDIDVSVMEDNVETVAQLNLDKIPMVDSTIEEAIKTCRNKNLFFSSSSKSEVKQADVIFVCTSSPLKNPPDEKNPHFIFLEKAARFIASSSDTSKIVVERSASQMKMADALRTILNANKSPDVNLVVVSNPPFIFEGCSMQDMLEPHHVVIGGDDTPEGKEAVDVIFNIYSNWVPKSRIMRTDITSAELTRIATSAFIAQKVTSINSFMELCEVTNADISEIVNIISRDSRIGYSFLNPYLGFSGSAFHRDVSHLVELSKSLNLPEVASYWQKIIEMNEYQRKRLIQRVLKCFFNSLADKKIAIFGLFHGKYPSSVLESPTYYICNMLLEEFATVAICDKSENNEKIKYDIKSMCSSKPDNIERVVVTDNPYLAAEGTQGIVVCSDLDLFKSLDYKRIHKGMIKPACIFDILKSLSHHRLKEIGFNVHSIGKHG
ncbi:hypothetical protein RUM43_011058 [Polyplax serrata]|uniref:UDP-glucose 6-dehydrogenase n=1 Tax=Polyplax serrata TaxID=468196 RepID=A0AAN8RTA9_POLSC